jgi:hypothetical protein
MFDEPRIGTNWQEDELDAIVAAYFGMLTADLAGPPYVESSERCIVLPQLEMEKAFIR